jgi:hypothetical protein
MLLPKFELLILGLPMKAARWKVASRLAFYALTFMVGLFTPSPRFAAGFPFLSLSLLPECSKEKMDFKRNITA